MHYIPPTLTTVVAPTERSELPAPNPAIPLYVLTAVVGLLLGADTLLTWIDASPDVQIVSTTAYRLFALVARGRFDAALYYRLNVILLNVDRRHDFGFHADIELRDADVSVPYA